MIFQKLLKTTLIVGLISLFWLGGKALAAPTYEIGIVSGNNQMSTERTSLKPLKVKVVAKGLDLYNYERPLPNTKMVFKFLSFPSNAKDQSLEPVFAFTNDEGLAQTKLIFGDRYGKYQVLAILESGERVVFEAEYLPSPTPALTLFDQGRRFFSLLGEISPSHPYRGLLLVFAGLIFIFLPLFWLRKTLHLVYRVENNTGLAKARVAIFDAKGKRVLETLTDEKGNFVAALPPGDYWVRIAKEGYRIRWLDFHPEFRPTDRGFYFKMKDSKETLHFGLQQGAPGGA